MESVKERKQCEGCNQLASSGFVVRFREQYGINKYLCSKCCHRDMGDYDKICCNCGKNNADGSFEMSWYNGKDMCSDCKSKELAKREHREALKLKIKSTLKNFAKDHWKFWISTAIAIIFGIIGISLI